MRGIKRIRGKTDINCIESQKKSQTNLKVPNPRLENVYCTIFVFLDDPIILTV